MFKLIYIYKLHFIKYKLLVQYVFVRTFIYKKRLLKLNTILLFTNLKQHGNNMYNNKKQLHNHSHTKQLTLNTFSGPSA